MNPSEWDRIESLFGEALDLPPAARAPYLDRNCSSIGSLREAVDRLLFEHEQTSGVLDRPLFAPAIRPEQDPWAGRVVNSRYRIERFIARGGMSAVYLAQDQQLAGKLVIVKFLHAWAHQDPRLKSKFRQEVEALARIDHRAVVGILGAGETADGLPFLVIEYIDGVTLRVEMSHGPMPAARVAEIIRQVARAVGAAHAKGVLHLDLKPENIMLESPRTPEECVRLIDFGIARLEEPQGGLGTSTTQFAGTAAYMAPEQLRGKTSAASDCYAMAVVAYEMLAGQRPFSGAGPVEIYEQQRSGASLAPLFHQGISEPAARLIAKQLAFGPHDRNSAAIEAGEALADTLLHPRKLIWSRRNTMLALAGGVAVAGGTFVSGTWWISDRERLINLPFPSEPLEDGFRSRGEIENHVVHNSTSSGYEALRLISGDQGGYYYSLSRAQAAAARRLGWRISFDAAAEEGETYCNLDIPGSPARYAVEITSRLGGPDVVMLTTGVSPVISGVELTLGGPSGSRHRYLLALPAGSSSAEFSVDGVSRYSGYKGVKEYLYRRGPEIGVARYRSTRGVGVFWSFRFEIG